MRRRSRVAPCRVSLLSPTAAARSTALRDLRCSATSLARSFHPRAVAVCRRACPSGVLHARAWRSESTRFGHPHSRCLCGIVTTAAPPGVATGIHLPIRAFVERFVRLEGRGARPDPDAERRDPGEHERDDNAREVVPRSPSCRGSTDSRAQDDGGRAAADKRTAATPRGHSRRACQAPTRGARVRKPGPLRRGQLVCAKSPDDGYEPSTRHDRRAFWEGRAAACAFPENFRGEDALAAAARGMGKPVDRSAARIIGEARDA